jgi:hypothetical protein
LLAATPQAVLAANNATRVAARAKVAAIRAAGTAGASAARARAAEAAEQARTARATVKLFTFDESVITPAQARAALEARRGHNLHRMPAAPRSKSAVLDKFVLVGGRLYKAKLRKDGSAFITVNGARTSVPLADVKYDREVDQKKAARMLAKAEKEARDVEARAAEARTVAAKAVRHAEEAEARAAEARLRAEKVDDELRALGYEAKHETLDQEIRRLERELAKMEREFRAAYGESAKSTDAPDVEGDKLLADYREELLAEEMANAKGFGRR